MVGIAPGKTAQHVHALFVETVSGAGVGRKNRDGAYVAHGRNARNENLPGVPAGVEKIVFNLTVVFAGLFVMFSFLTLFASS